MNPDERRRPDVTTVELVRGVEKRDLALAGLFRDRLREDAADTELYERTKRRLIIRDWTDMNAYSDAKSDVIAEIKDRARSTR